MSNISIGYTPNEVNELTKRIAGEFKNVGEAVAGGWKPLVNVLSSNWVGPDEMDFELKLSKHICKLYFDCTEATSTLIKNIVATANSDQEFQNSNRLDIPEYGEALKTSFTFEAPAIETYDMEEVVKLITQPADKNASLGIVTGSGSTIKSAISSYVDDIQQKIKNIFNVISSTQAFHGAIANALDEYVKTIGEFIAALASNLEEFYNVVDKLTETSYGSQDEGMSQSINTEKENTDGIKSQFGSIGSGNAS